MCVNHVLSERSIYNYFSSKVDNYDTFHEGLHLDKPCRERFRAGQAD